jgi:hypothetical protein
MRKLAYVMAALLISSPAAAQWKEFSSVPEGFAVAFPAEPEVQDVEKYEIVPGKTVPAKIYSVRYNNGLFKMTVADARDAGLQEAPVLQQAVKNMTQGGQVKIDFPHRIYRIYGRQMSITRPDNSLTTAAAFFANERLYQIESTKFVGGSDTDLLMFQQSLTFDRNVWNRSPQEVQAIRAACNRGVAGNDAPGNPAGLGDPRCAQD